jgi:hypothetical protein
VLRFDAPVLMRNIELFNPAGQLIASQYDLQVREYVMSLNYLGSGIYFCRIETEKGIFVHRLVKE